MKKKKKKLTKPQKWAKLMKNVPKIKVTKETREKFRTGIKTKRETPKIKGTEISSYWNRLG